MRRVLFLVIFGIGGLAILVSLGSWQLQRLSWKREILNGIDARIAQEPVSLPANPDPIRDQFLAVTASGRILPEGQKALVSVKGRGPGYRMIHPFALDDGRRVLIDRGFVALENVDTVDIPEGSVSVVGNLHWPEEIDRFTPAPDLAERLWFARDVPALAALMRTEPVLIVVAKTSDPGTLIEPLPVDSAAIPNDHLQYAITWFALALIWIGMTVYSLRRSQQRSDKGPTE